MVGPLSRTSNVGAIALSTCLMIVGILPAQAMIWGVKTHDPFTEPPSTLFRFEENGAGLITVGEILLANQSVTID